MLPLFQNDVDVLLGVFPLFRVEVGAAAEIVLRFGIFSLLQPYRPSSAILLACLGLSLNRSRVISKRAVEVTHTPA